MAAFALTSCTNTGGNTENQTAEASQDSNAQFAPAVKLGPLQEQFVGHWKVVPSKKYNSHEDIRYTFRADGSFKFFIETSGAYGGTYRINEEDSLLYIGERAEIDEAEIDGTIWDERIKHNMYKIIDIGIDSIYMAISVKNGTWDYDNLTILVR